MMNNIFDWHQLTFFMLNVSLKLNLNLMLIYGRRYVCAGQCDVVSGECDEPTSYFMRSVCLDQRDWATFEDFVSCIS